MQEQLLTEQGSVMSQEQKEIPPVCLQFFRNSLQRKLAGGALRESLTICWTLDLMLRGRLSEASDCLSQRLKALELIGNGAAWNVAQRIELVPPDKAQLANRAEATLAAKESQAEAKVNMQTKGKKKGKGEGGSYPWKGQQKGDSKGKDKGKQKRSDKEKGKK
mmetsp:Transcript_8232/g.9854  ORF Transcript_8232/g.9854 Transcript_8232/m.9854 type:complete len:163 (+) Transcript_8232:3-491(+)